MFLWASLIKLTPGLSRVPGLGLTLYFQGKQPAALVQGQGEEWAYDGKKKQVFVLIADLLKNGMHD